MTAAVDVPPTANPTLVASADPEPQAVRPRPQPVERRTLASDQSQKSARKDTALARPGRNAQGAPAPAVATAGAAVPGDEVITSATLPDNGLVRSAATRPVPAAVVRVVDGGSVPTVASNKGHPAREVDPQGAEVSINGIVPGPHAAGDSRSRCG